jgi:hypothetical protein
MDGNRDLAERVTVLDITTIMEARRVALVMALAKRHINRLRYWRVRNET